MTVQGTVEPGWEPVADVLERSLDDGSDVGASVAIYREGRPVVDVWGGVADRDTDRAWSEGTVAAVFSATKGATAICAHMLAERGALDLDAPVARYWPEFAAADKGSITTRDLLTHRAGLPVLDTDLTFQDLRAVTPVLRAIEAQPPHWEPGTQFAYHAVTFGHLVGEVVRRITGATLGTFFRRTVVEPLGLQAWIGLPADADVDLARIVPAEVDPAMAALLETLEGPAGPVSRVITLGSALPLHLVTGEPGDMNDRDVLAVELGAASMVTDARSLARMYAATVSDVDGVRILSDATAAECSVIRTSELPVWGAPPAAPSDPRTLDFADGFMAAPLLGPTSFGHPGASGSLGFADFDARLAMAYVPNRMGGGPVGDPRATQLVEAVRRCL